MISLCEFHLIFVGVHEEYLSSADGKWHKITPNTIKFMASGFPSIGMAICPDCAKKAMEFYDEEQKSSG